MRESRIISTFFPARGRRSTGFTLVELLVVIAIIALLISVLLPSLAKARQSARDIACASNMRQAMMAVFSYNNDYRGGLKNYMSSCPWWGQGWPGAGPGYGGGAHATAPDHLQLEGRDRGCYWRGYLMQGKYARCEVLGCNVEDYTQEIYFQGSYNDQPANEFTGYPTNADWPQTGYPNETFSYANSFKRFPAYVWYGEPAFDYGNVGGYSNGVKIVEPFYGASRMMDARGGMDTFKHRRLLFLCPTVNVFYLNNVKRYQLPHRQNWWTNVDGGNTGYSYAGNAAFTDGSVKFVSYKAPAQSFNGVGLLTNDF